MSPRLRRFIEIVAAERTIGQPDLFDECVQEGMIAAWQAMERHPGKPEVYYRVAAKNGIMDALRGRTFGRETRRGWRDAHGSSESLWETSEDGQEVMVVEPAMEAPYAALDVQEAVREAVAELSPEDRALVFSRYWEDHTWAELARLIGVRKNRLEWRWMMSIRPALVESLGHLGAVA